MGVISLEDIEFDTAFQEWEQDKVTDPIGRPPLADLMPGTGCYLCDYAAVTRSAEGHPLCHRCFRHGGPN